MSLARERARTGPGTGMAAAAGFGVAVLLALGGLAYVRSTRPESAVVARRDIVAIANIEGEAIAPPDARADVLPPYHTTVAKVYSSVGDHVRRGATLVELTLPNVQEMYAQARENFRAAETGYANARKQYDASIAEARRSLNQARAAEKSAREPVASVTTAPDASVSVTTQPDPGKLSQATQARQQAEGALQQAIAARDAALAPYKQQLATAREQLQEAQSGRKQALVRAPITGTVLALNAQPNAEVGKDRRVPIATIVDLDRLEVQARLTDAQSTAMKAGLPAEIKVTVLPTETFRGKVASLTTTPPSGLLKKSAYVALVSLENRRGLVKPGMKAAAFVNEGEARSALAAPADAVKHDSQGRPTVRVQRGGQWQTVIVDTGLSDGKWTEIRGGLNEGEAVRVK